MVCPISGGNWNNAANAGVWALNLNNNRSNSNNNVGFRSDYDPPQSHYWNSGTQGDFFPTEMKISVKSVCIIHLVDLQLIRNFVS